MRTCLLVISAVLACGVQAAEPVAPVSQVRIPTKDRSWKIVYGTSEGPEGRALELLSAEVGSLYQRDPGVYTLHVVPCEKADSVATCSATNRILVGTRESNAEIAKCVSAADVPADGYLVKTLDAGRTLVIVGSSPSAVIWGVADFVDDGFRAMSVEEWDGLRYRSKVFERPALASYESRRAPKTPVRGVFTWGHVIDDYRTYFRNLARLKINEVILWNNCPPVNAREIVDYAHSWGIAVLWGYSWGWSTDCSKVDWKNLQALEDAIVREWQSVWKPLGGDGIYFQSFTEIDQSTIDGHPVAETVVGLVNRVAARIRQKDPRERLLFGLHARESVRNSLSAIDRTDPSVEIYWEDCGGFPFNYAMPLDVAAYNRLTDVILSENREVALVLKGMLNQDWKRFAYQAGPYVLGCASETVKAEDDRTASALWAPLVADWRTRGREAYDVIRRVQAARPGRPARLNVAGNFNGKVRYPLALVAEMFWSADEPYETIVERVNRRVAAE